jgi:hypothetical protein
MTTQPAEPAVGEIVTERQESTCAKCAEIAGAILRKADEATTWTMGRGPCGSIINDRRTSLMRLAGQLSSFWIGAALAPIPASQVDPKPRRSRSNVIVAHIPRRCRSRSLSGEAAAG